MGDALAQIDRVLGKSRFWLLHRQQSLGPEQIKVLNRLLDGFEVSASNTMVSTSPTNSCASRLATRRPRLTMLVRQRIVPPGTGLK